MSDFFKFSKFLYDLTRDDGTNPSRSVVQQWLKSIGSKIGVVMRWTQRIHGALVNRANFLKRQQRILKGGAPRARFFQNEWKLNVQVGEIVTQVEHTLSAEVRKRAEEIRSLEADKLHLQEKVCSLSTPSPSSSRASKRPLEELSDRQQRRRKQQQVQQCEDALGFLQKEGIVPTKIEFLDMGSGRTEAIELNVDEVEAMFGPDPMMTQDDEDQINMMLFVKDRYDLSQDAYHEMAKICKEMPRHYLLKRRVAELNKLWNIKPTPNGTCGVQQTIEDRLRVQVSHLHKTAAADAKF